jgi:hypothetical protein
MTPAERYAPATGWAALLLFLLLLPRLADALILRSCTAR